MLDSVTVSIAAETTGVFRIIFFENLETVLTSLGSISEYPGANSTSSYVRPSNIILEELLDILQPKFEIKLRTNIND